MPKRWRWTEEEECYLQKIAHRYLTEFYEGYLWEEIAKVLNRAYDHNRTATACQNRFYRLHGDDYKFIDREKN